MNNKQAIVMTTLAIYQTDFWVKVAHYLSGKGYHPVLISYDDRSTEEIERQGIECYSGYEKQSFVDYTPMDDKSLATFLAGYGIDDLRILLSHERVNFSLTNSKELSKKLVCYLKTASEVLEGLKKRHHTVTMVQELGGFVSVLACYYASLKESIDCYYLEPSCLKGRLFFTRNSFVSPRIGDTLDTALPDCTEQVVKYIDDTIAKSTIVIPKKDAHHYASAYRKVLNKKNAKRLINKLTDKHLLGKHQEFGYNGLYVKNHLLMLCRSLRLAKFYETLDQIDQFVYFPLHVPGDAAITIRSPEYLDQIALLDYIARIMPLGYKLVVKEHPAMIGAMGYTALKKLLKNHDNVVLLQPKTNNYDVLKKASCVVTINSKTGAEALTLQKPVIALGDAFYNTASEITFVDNLSKLKEQTIVDAINSAVDINKVYEFFKNVWQQTDVGELYVNNDVNIAQFTDALLDTVNKPLVAEPLKTVV